jgi:GrpB-like predicted nucleotidyltransferase (UPF0157 family)
LNRTNVTDRITTAHDAPIQLVPYDPSWPQQFEHERAQLARILATWTTGPIEHIGSTAIPGLAAKPIIDIMAPVQDLDVSRDALPAVASHGYLYFPYHADVMHWFCKPSPSHRTHHLHLVPAGSRLWIERLAFRDHLRRNAAMAAEYSALKHHLAAVHQHDREAYTDAKGPFVQRVLELALTNDLPSGTPNRPARPRRPRS